ncbi:MAG: hypothetical protein D6800_04665, partial [Candidatus Zixiibacteriota bacterium]
MTIARTRFFIISLISACWLLSCGSAGNHRTVDETPTGQGVATTDTSDSADSLSTGVPSAEDYTAVSDSEHFDPNAQPQDSGDDNHGNAALKLHKLSDQNLADSLFSGAVTAEDSAAAVDDDIWRQFDLADD